MRTWTIFIIVFFVGLFACNEAPICPINYTIDYSNTNTIRGNWKLLGFYKEGANSLVYPPCEGYDHWAEYEISLFLGDTLQDTSLCNYPLTWSAYGGVNWGGGCYTHDSLDYIAFGTGSAWTEIYGPKEMHAYEEKYAMGIYDAYKYEIHNNILTIYYSPTESMIFIAK